MFLTRQREQREGFGEGQGVAGVREAAGLVE